MAKYHWTRSYNLDFDPSILTDVERKFDRNTAANLMDAATRYIDMGEHKELYLWKSEDGSLEWLILNDADEDAEEVFGPVHWGGGEE